MKNNFYVFSVLFTVFLFTGCSSNSDNIGTEKGVGTDTDTDTDTVILPYLMIYGQNIVPTYEQQVVEPPALPTI